MSLDVYKLTDKKARLIWLIIVFITHLLADHEPIKIHSISGSIRVLFVSVVKKKKKACSRSYLCPDVSHGEPFLLRNSGVAGSRGLSPTALIFSFN